MRRIFTSPSRNIFLLPPKHFAAFSVIRRTPFENNGKQNDCRASDAALSTTHNATPFPSAQNRDRKCITLQYHERASFEVGIG
jgi:hypothetical protein